MTNIRLIAGIIIGLIGLGFLVDVNILRLIFPAILILIGIAIIAGRNVGFFNGAESTASSEDRINRVFIFSGMNKKFVSSDFQGAEIVAVFGGGEMDLRQVKVRKDSVKLSFVAIFGGFKVMVPRSWSIKAQGIGILGAFDNKTTASKGSVEAVIDGVAIFGGVEIVN